MSEILRHKYFRHIEYFHDAKRNKTIVLFALDQSCDPDIFAAIDNYRVEMQYGDILFLSNPVENRTTPPSKTVGKLLWITVNLQNAPRGFRVYQCSLYKKNTLIGVKKVTVGYKLRKRIILKFKRFIFPACRLFAPDITKYSKPLITIHLWHLDVAQDILLSFKETSHYFDLRVVVPDNLDQSITDSFLNHLENKYFFQNVNTLQTSSVGRDIGGFISSLIYSMQSDAFKNRPHLFIHTKNTPHLDPALVLRWRDSLIDDIAYQINLLLSLLLTSYFGASIVYSKSNDRVEDGLDFIVARRQSFHLAKSLSEELFAGSNEDMRFCAGSMMWVVPSRVEKVWSIEKLQSVFSKLEPSPTMEEPSYAHAFERVFPDAVRRMGLKVYTI